jgi:heme oxygenase (biliverdin-producing, ferredoxin)
MTAEQARNGAPSVVAALYHSTRALHREAERTGIIAEILHGRADRRGYALLLRNLHSAYRAIEDGLAQHRGEPVLGPLADRPLSRAPAIEADLIALQGPNWRSEMPLLPEAEAYAERVRDAGRGDGSRLIAHAYTRYLGDLNGGQIVRQLLEKTLGLGISELSHYDFSKLATAADLKVEYRQMLDRAGAASSDATAVIDEGAAAFNCNIAVSIAVQRHIAGDATRP